MPPDEPLLQSDATVGGRVRGIPKHPWRKKPAALPKRDIAHDEILGAINICWLSGLDKVDGYHAPAISPWSKVPRTIKARHKMCLLRACWRGHTSVTPHRAGIQFSYEEMLPGPEWQCRKNEMPFLKEAEASMAFGSHWMQSTKFLIRFPESAGSFVPHCKHWIIQV